MERWGPKTRSHGQPPSAAAGTTAKRGRPADAFGGRRHDRSHKKGQSMNEQQILQQVRDALAQIKVPGAEAAGMETTWADLDVDSLDLVEVVRILEDHYGIQIVDEKLEGIESVGDAVRLIQSIAAEQEGVSA
jgi:acyl carrier protein